jgi:hypothetical protein
MAESITKRFVSSARITDDPVGDLIADMRRDPNLPRLFPNIKAVREYLRQKNASPAAVAAVPIFWRRFNQFITRPRV